jgi:heavy metal translocating P-type ATPase
METIKEWFLDKEKRTIMLTALSGISLIISFFGWVQGILPFDSAWVAVILSGFPIVKGAMVGLVKELDIRADVLVSIALVASLIIGETFAAGEVAFIMIIGALLEKRTVRKAREGIEELAHLTPRTARIIKNDVEMVIPAEKVAVGDILRVLPGEALAVDGIITAGQTAIDQSIMTGESLPVDKGVGDEVFSGTVNQFGAFEMQATKVGEDSSLQRMIRLVELADASKTPIVRLMDRWATWIVGIALISALLTWLITGEVIRAVTILVVFCPCALVLATPTAIMAGIGNGTKFGILIRSGDALERLSKVRCVAFDKTGTLTFGKPKVVAVESFAKELSVNELLLLTAAAEQRSEHPLGQAILHYAEASNSVLPEPEDFVMVPGRGVKARIKDREVLAGNLELFKEEGIGLPDEMRAAALSQRHEGCTVIFVSVAQKPAGMIVLSDTLRENARYMVERIHASGMKTILLTGDNLHAAANMAEKVGIKDVQAELLPEHKMAVINEYQQTKNEQICMVGDGVNDAPALKTACVGVAMGGIGSDIAVDAADITLVSDDIHRIPYLLRLAQKTMRTINLNILLSMSLNFVAIILAALGMLGPVIGALIHNAGSVAVVVNSAFLLKFKDDSAA